MVRSVPKIRLAIEAVLLELQPDVLQAAPLLQDVVPLLQKMDDALSVNTPDADSLASTATAIGRILMEDMRVADGRYGRAILRATEGVYQLRRKS